MSKGEVRYQLGEPISTSSPGPGQEYLYYTLTSVLTTNLAEQQGYYYVYLEDGKVQQYGREGEFDSPAHTEWRSAPIIETTQETSETRVDRMKSELLGLKELLDENIITQEEFDQKKKEILSRY